MCTGSKKYLEPLAKFEYGWRRGKMTGKLIVDAILTGRTHLLK